MKIKKLLAVIFGLSIMTFSIFAEEKKTQVEISFSINWIFGCYKETTFANISQTILAPRFQLDSKIYSGNMLHIITADYYFFHPDSAMTNTAVVYKNYDPVSGESYYEGFQSNLAFHRIRLQYDAAYDVLKKEKYDLYVGGNFSCNAYLQFENYPSITGIISIGPTTVFKYNIDERNSFMVTGSMPWFGYGVRPPYAGCDAQLMKYAEENFMKILTLGNFLSLHNYQSISLGFDYRLRASKHFSTGLGFSFEYSRIAVPKERPLYYLDGNFRTVAIFNF
jgi:hypothetical protein